MKKILFVIAVLLCAAMAYSQDTYTREGNNFTKTETVTTSQDSLTTYTYTYKAVVYPIYITKNGRCYIVRMSKKGNEYRQYLDESIARQICKEMGIEYKESNK